MDAIEVLTISDVSSERFATPTEESIGEAEAAKTPAIRFGSSTEPFFFLSNLSPSRITFGAFDFLTAEAAFQATKFRKHPKLQLAIVNTKWPGDAIAKAQSWANYVPEDWEEQRLSIMEEVLMLKYTQNDQLRARLLQTGDAELIFTSNIDRYFGRDQHDHGQNHLGKLLMSIRALLRTRPAELSKCFKSSAYHNVSRSTVWHISHASEEWYSTGKTPFHEITIEPAVEEAPASEHAFLHSIVHGKKPWSLQFLIQVQKRVLEGDKGLCVVLNAQTCFGCVVLSEVKILPKDLKTTSKGADGEDFFIYGFTHTFTKQWREYSFSILSATAKKLDTPYYRIILTQSDD